jgi:aldehyde dehydrogenase (NAD+)
LFTETIIYRKSGLQKIRSQAMTTAYTKFYINGAWVEPKADTTLEVINPATEEPCAVISMGNADDVDAAAQAARAAFPAWSQSSVEERMAVIQKIMAGMQARAGDLASAISA